MAIRFGFPIVLQNGPTGQTCATVWVTTRRKAPNEQSRIYWNGHDLDLALPFGNGNPILTELTTRIAQHSILHFRSKEPPEQRNGVYQYPMKGASAGLLLALCETYIIPQAEPGDTLDVLLSGAVDRNTRAAVDLADISGLRAKGKYAVENNAALVLHPNDYAKLDQESGWAGKPGSPSAVLPASASAVQDALVNFGAGRAFSISRQILAEQDWRRSMADLFGLERIVQEPTRLAGVVPVSEELSEAPDEGTIGKLFRSAVPTDGDYWRSLVAKNKRGFGKPVFQDGVVQRSLRPDINAQLFCPRDGRQSFEYRHVFLGGPTGCGKTFLAEALVLNSAVELGRPVLYIGPIRALIYELHEKFVSRYCVGPALPKESVLYSTGEYGAHDRRLRRGDFKVAFVVNEKANLLLSPDQQLLRRVGLVVVDEAHMMAHPERGGVLDMMVAKLLEQNRLRANGGVESGLDANPVRLVMITTEEMTGDKDVVKLFTPDVGLEPAAVFTNRRPIPVQHELAVLSDANRRIPVVTFSSDDDRKLSATHVDSIVQAHGSRFVLAKQTGGERRDAVIDLLEGLQKTYKRFLVVSNSIKMNQELARQLKNRRKGSKQKPVRAVEGFRREAESGIVTPVVAKSLVELARYGVFFHNSELHRDLRSWIQRHYAQPVKPDDPAEFVFTTETLTYGVNLAADCVVLIDVFFWRINPSTLKPASVPLSANEYHNIVGRVGRPDFYDYHKGRPDLAEENVKPLAVICLTDDLAVPDALRTLLDRYYATPSITALRNRRFSSLVLKTDLALANKENVPLDRFSYTTFRTVMDGLRYIALRKVPGYAAPDEIVDLMRSTVHWNTQQQERSNTEALVDRVLEAAVAETGMELVRPNATGREFAIRPQAAALIDTGTNWKSVRPLRDWLGYLTTLKKEAAGATIPVEFMVPGFVVSIDLWLGARTFCWEYGEASVPTQTAQDIEHRVRTLMHAEATRLSTNSIADAFCTNLKTFVDGRDLDGIIEPSSKRAAVYRLVTALFRWLRGASADQVDRLSLKDPLDDRPSDLDLTPFQSKIYERASWLTVMCLRFFGAWPDLLLPEHIRELFRLSLRLRHGVSSDGLPFIQDASPRSKLNRIWVNQLLGAGLTPSKVITSNRPVNTVVNALVAIAAASGLPASDNGERAESIAENSGLPASDIAERAESIAEDLFRFYTREISDLLTEIKNDVTAEHIDQFSSLVLSMLNRAVQAGVSTTDEENARLDRILNELLSFGRRDQGSHVDSLSDEEAVKNSAQVSEKWLKSVKESWRAPRYPRPGEFTVFVRHLWLPQDADTSVGVHISSFGALVLTVLLARDFLKVGHVRVWAVGRTPGFASIRDLVGELPLKGLPLELREVLLGFEEPGWVYSEAASRAVAP